MESFNPSDENGETDKAKEKPEIVAHPDKPPKTHLQKYVQGSDFIEQQIGIDNQSKHKKSNVTAIAFELLDVINLDQLVLQLLEHDLYHIFLDLSIMCAQKDRHQIRVKLIISMFTQAVRQDEDSCALHMSMQFESRLLKNTGDIVPVILSKLENDLNHVNEITMSILQRLQPKFHFKHAVALVAILEQFMNSAFKVHGLILKQSNPLMLVVLVTYLMQKMREQFRSLNVRIDFVNDKFQEIVASVYDYMDEPERTECLLKQKDFKGISVLQHLSNLKMYRFLQINHINRIVCGMWRSKTDIGGSVFDKATSYHLVFVNKLAQKEDNELYKRFYKQDLDELQPHQFNIMVWQRSISLRYLIETIVFFCIMLLFQYEIGLFNKDLHVSIDEVKHFKALEHELEARNLLTYRDLHDDRRDLSTEIETEKETVREIEEEAAEEAVSEHGYGDLTKLSNEEIYEQEKDLHDHLLIEFRLVREELNLILDISAICFTFPLQMISKHIFGRFTRRQIFFTISDYIDIVIFMLVAWVWQVVKVYESTPIKEELFGQPEDSELSIRFVDNVIYDITNDIFHLDYLMAVVTATLWIRCIFLLRLSESTGPMLVMIYEMLMLSAIFLFVYMLGIITFACIATLTLSSNPNFANLFEATRTYVMASLGNFDLYQHDATEGWKRYYGIFLHIGVLFFNMILMINLLIAIMSDQYSVLSATRTGLFWTQAIQEMPKHSYNRQYGILSMTPFFFSWMNFFFLPILLLLKTDEQRETLNKIAFMIIYTPVFLVLLVVFIAVNALLIPFAYVKTIMHKINLLATYKSRSHLQNVVIFFFFGIPLLVLTQFTDVYRFTLHSYRSKFKQQADQTFLKTVTLEAFEEFVSRVLAMVEIEGKDEMNAVDFVIQLRKEKKIMNCISNFLFGLQATYLQYEHDDLETIGVGVIRRVETASMMKRDNLKSVQTFNILKNLIWSCVLADPNDKDTDNQVVSLHLLRDLMVEIQVYVEYAKLMKQYEIRTTCKREEFDQVYREFKIEDDYHVKHVLKRFANISPAAMYVTIKRCEALGLINQ